LHGLKRSRLLYYQRDFQLRAKGLLVHMPCNCLLHTTVLATVHCIYQNKSCDALRHDPVSVWCVQQGLVCLLGSLYFYCSSGLMPHKGVCQKRCLKERVLYLVQRTFPSFVDSLTLLFCRCAHLAGGNGYDCQLPACPSGPHAHGGCSSRGSRRALRCKHSACCQALQHC